MALLSAVLLTACSSGGEEENSATVEDCFLDIYVYSPGRPIVTRAEVGDIKAADDEKRVNSLQIWVFKHADGSLVSYKDTTATYLNEEAIGQQKFQMKIDKTFADNPENVDVYVVANAASCGLTLGESTPRSDLDAAQIKGDYFGTSTLTHAVPDGGLPMSAVLHNQPITGRFPTLRIGTESEMATLQLTRAVSRLRFVLCRIKEDENKTRKKLVSIDNIQLDANQIPTASYLIQRQANSFSYSHDAIDYGSVEKESIPEVKDPMLYAYETQEAQDYESMIDGAVNGSYKADESDPAKPLFQLGLTYFRESDKQLKGTVKYQIKERDDVSSEWKTATTEEATFTMAAPGDFLRNHSWIVYIYFMDAKIHVLTVTNIGIKKWTNGGSKDHTVHNW